VSTLAVPGVQDGRARLSAPPTLRWERPATGALLAGAAALYLVGLDRSGWGNSFYAAAAQAGAQSWKAFFFGASDAPATITVDKPPAAIWLMSLSVRLFGLSSWSLLVPEALLGVATVALLVATVRRVAGPWAGLLAGLLFALTPVLTLMARVDDPDALLTLLLVAAAWSTTRAIDDGRFRWAVLTGALLGVAFLTKSLAALLVLPGLAAAFLLAAPGPLLRRAGHLLAAGGALVVAGGWWLLVVELIPASSRPWVGGSAVDSPLDLALGYNGLGRLTGNESSAGVRALDTQSPLRLLGSAADQFGWLLPAAVIGTVAGLVLCRGRPRTDPVRAALVLWAGWALPTAAVFSVMRGVWHPYYTVELAPAVAALTALAAVLLWRRHTGAGLAVLAAGSLVTTGWALSLIDRRMAPTGAVATLVLACGLIGVPLLAVAGTANRPVARMGAAFVLVAATAGPAAWSLATAEVPHTGSSVRAGPSSGAQPRGPVVVSPALTRMLRRDTDDWTWAAATVGRRAADLQLAVGAPVMPIGGFFGRDPAPTLAQFQADVRAHRIHWYVRGMHGSGPAPQIDGWVRRNAPAVQVGAATAYDLAGLAPGHHEDRT
jgi:4-amino-4-deoxy-L-arabinose transferase-like glycosyltransferase